MNWYKFLVLVVLLGLAIPAFGQEATIVGTVSDPTGATVPNAGIAITNIETGQVLQFSSNEAGQFVAPGLHIGHYTIRTQVAGFKPMEQKEIVLQVGDRLRVDFKLELGNAAEQITVEATPVAVQSDSSEVSGVISGQQVTQIATNGRNIYLLATLLPGVSNAMNGDFQLQLPVSSDANISFNGLRTGHNRFVIDGGEAYDRGGEGRLSVMPSLESIAEFRALTSNYSAEYASPRQEPPPWCSNPERNKSMHQPGSSSGMTGWGPATTSQMLPDNKSRYSGSTNSALT